MKRHRLAMPAAAAALALPVLHLLRGYTWPMAIVTAIAIGVLAYALRRTIEQIRMALHAHRVDHDPPKEAPDE